MYDSKYTHRQWDRTVGYGSVPSEYNIEVERLQHENKVLRKLVHSLSSNTKKQPCEKIKNILLKIFSRFI